MSSFFASAVCRLQYPYQILRNKFLGTQNPLIVVLVVNNACNLKCKYCFGQYCNRTKAEDFSTQELKGIIDELYRLGTRLLTVHGGETLLREDIGEIVRYMKAKNMYVNLITNGILLESKLEQVRLVDSLCISLDGREEGNDLNRGKGAYQAALRAIRLAKKEGIRLRVHATITRHTKNDVGFLAQLEKEIGFSQEFSVLYACGGVSENMEELSISDAETKEVIRDIVAWKKKGYPIYTAERVLENAINWPAPYSKPFFRQEEIPQGFKSIPCHYGRTKFILDADGKVYPCFALLDSFDALNVRAVGVKKAIEHARAARTCSACVHLTNNDHNLLLGFSPRHVFKQCILQLKELTNRY